MPLDDGQGSGETTREQDIGAAIDKLSGGTGDAPPATPAPGTGEPPASPPPPVTGDEPPATPPAAPDEERRDALGRFIPKTGAKPAAAASVPQAPVTPPAVPPAAPLADKFAKPPASWKPEEAAHWAKLPPEAREVIARREAEFGRAMQESASARRGIEAMQRVLQPFSANIQASGGDAVAAIKNFFSFDNRLRHGSHIERAKAVTEIIRNYGVDIVALDAELAGAPHDPQAVNQNAISAALQRELQPFRDFLAQQRTNDDNRYQQMQQSVGSAIETFAADPANVHFNAVRLDMADMLDIAAKNNRELSLKDAYEQCCWQNPQVRAILLQQQAASTAQNQTQAAQRARAAAASVRSTPKVAAPVGADAANRSRLEDVAAAFDKHSQSQQQT